MSKRSLNARFQFKQQLKNKEYVQFIKNILSQFSISNLKKDIQIKPIKIDNKWVYNHDVKNGFYIGILFQTIAHPVFTELRNKWYQGNKKIIPKDLHLTWRTVAFWYADDGSNNNPKKTISLATNCFSKDDVLFLIKRLEEDLSIKATINKTKNQYLIAIGAKYYFLFIKKVKKYLNQFKCFEHKLNIKNAGKVDLKNYNCRSLDNNQIYDIIKLYDRREMTINLIAKKMNVSKSTVARVIRSTNTNPNYNPTNGMKITPDKVIHIVNLWNSGMLQNDVAKLMNISQSLVGQITRRKCWQSITNDMEIRKSRANRKPTKEKLIGLNMQEISLKYGVQKQTVRKWLMFYGLYTKNKLTNKKILEINTLYFNNDYTQREVSKMTNVSISSVAKALKKTALHITGSAKVQYGN